MTSRLAEVDPERLTGWVERFEASHGTAERAAGAGGALVLVAADGAVAHLELLWPAPAARPLDLADLVERAAASRTAALLLVRRGGWVAGVVADGRVLEAAGGTRYVQSRTAAGGWSQQRYARRRAGQAAGLVSAAVTGAARLLGARAEVLAVGGDRPLVAATLDEPPLAPWAALPRSPLLDVPGDPRRAVLPELAARVRRVRVTVTDP